MSNLHPIFGQILDNVQKASAVVANATTKPERCGRHTWVRKGGAWSDAEDPGYYQCSVCRYTQDEIEHELAELRQAAEKYTEEINAETERADNAEVAAKLNAQTITDQQRAYQKELDALYAKLSTRNNRIDELMRVQLELIDQKNRAIERAESAERDRDAARVALGELEHDLETAVVDIRTKVAPPLVETLTLAAILENGDYRDLCPCGDAECPGCTPNPKEIEAEAAGDAGEWGE